MPRAIDGMKQCWRCRETKPVSEYGKDKRSSDGLQGKCKSCCSTLCKQYYIENKEKIKEQHKQYYTKNSEERKEWQRQYHQEVIKTEPYVYIATDRSTGCFYIGKSASIFKERFRHHKEDKRTGLGGYINEHNLSLNDFEIEQHQCSSVEESTALERKLIAENIDNPLCLNKRLG